MYSILFKIENSYETHYLQEVKHSTEQMHKKSELKGQISSISPVSLKFRTDEFTESDYESDYDSRISSTKKFMETDIAGPGIILFIDINNTLVCHLNKLQLTDEPIRYINFKKI